MDTTTATPKTAERFAILRLDVGARPQDGGQRTGPLRLLACLREEPQ
ncbi:MAG TPA: hypothetical protein VFI50_03515 [Casimicrobiaceae bacterium]|nr:hypothetical protein [Casimicrobiaceae bacterium]